MLFQRTAKDLGSFIQLNGKYSFKGLCTILNHRKSDISSSFKLAKPVGSS